MGRENKMKIRYIMLFNLVLLLSALSLLVTSAYSQTYQSFNSELVDIDEMAKWKIGPFRIHPTLEFRNFGYTSNIYGVRDEDGPVPDFIAFISPEVKVYLPYRNWLILSFSENPEYIFFAKERNQRALNNGYSPGFRMLLLRRFVLSGNYLNRRTTRRPSSETEVPVTYIAKRLDSSIVFELTRRISFGFLWSDERLSYEDETLPGWDVDLSVSLNRRIQSASFEFFYNVFTRGQIFIRGGYSEYSFENIESRWRDSYSYEARVGIGFPIIKHSGGTLSYGFRKVLPREKGKMSYSGPIGSAGLYFRLGRFNFSVQYSRDFQFSFSAINVYFIENIYGAGISYYLSQSLRLNYSFAYGRNNYPEPILIQPQDDQYKEIFRTDTYRTHSVGFLIRVVNNIGMGLSLSKLERRSNYGGLNMNSFFVGGNFSYKF